MGVLILSLFAFPLTGSVQKRSYEWTPIEYRKTAPGVPVEKLLLGHDTTPEFERLSKKDRGATGNPQGDGPEVDAWLGLVLRDEDPTSAPARS